MEGALRMGTDSGGGLRVLRALRAEDMFDDRLKLSESAVEGAS